MNNTVEPNSVGNISVLIVDDEAHARNRVRQLLSTHESVSVVGEAKDGFEAVDLVQKLQPDVVFLDVQMPGRDGFDVLKQLHDSMPAIVFVTAFDEYAIKAFEFNAIDYVLKPIDRQRFDEALGRAIERIQFQRDINGESQSQLADADPVSIAPDAGLIDGPTSNNQRLLVKTQGVYRIVEVCNILWIEAADKYVHLHTPDQMFTCRHTMRELESKLNSNMFVRVHRSSIVNIDAIAEIQPHFHGDFKIVLNNQTVLTLSRSYRQAFESKFHNKL